MPTPTTPQRQTLTIPEVAQILGVSVNTAYLAAEHGELPCIRIGRRVLVPRPALEKLLAGAAETAQEERAAQVMKIRLHDIA